MEWRGERDGSQGSHARGSRVKKLRNGIEFETCLRGSSEWRRCVPLPHSCIILAFVLTGYPASASGGWGGKPPRLLQPAFPPRLVTPCRARRASAQDFSSSTRIFHTISHSRLFSTQNFATAFSKLGVFLAGKAAGAREKGACTFFHFRVRNF